MYRMTLMFLACAAVISSPRKSRLLAQLPGTADEAEHGDQHRYDGGDRQGGHPGAPSAGRREVCWKMLGSPELHDHPASRNRRRSLNPPHMRRAAQQSSAWREGRLTGNGAAKHWKHRICSILRQVVEMRWTGLGAPAPVER